MADAALLDRLSRHRTLAAAPRHELQWLVDHGHVRVLEVGDVLSHAGGTVAGLYVVLEGHLSIRVDMGAGPRTVMEWRSGDVTGALPYSRIKAPPADVVARERSEIFAVSREDFPALTRECCELTAALVHVMVDRARVFKSSELLDEKLLSLGRLAAGLAHELNNPASAAARGARTLAGELEALEGATRRLCALTLTDAQHEAIAAIRVNRGVPTTWSPLELADREEAFDDRLASARITGVDAAPLAASALTVEDIREIERLVGPDRVGPTLAYLARSMGLHRLVEEIHVAASRISTLVGAVKGFTYMDQHAAPQPVELVRGLADTLTVLGAKARQRAVDVRLDVPAELPRVHGYGGELNQVWANLVDNAIDAVPGGHVRVTAEPDGDHVVVRVADDGPGIAPDVQRRMFDPFFTTKPVGEGTGLGLDIARRIVHRHHGELRVATGPGGTEFSVRLPVSA